MKDYQEEIRTLIGDATPTEYMACLIKKVEEDAIALKKAEINLGLLKQMNNRANVLLRFIGNRQRSITVKNTLNDRDKKFLESLDERTGYRFTKLLHLMESITPNKGHTTYVHYLNTLKEKGFLERRNDRLWYKTPKKEDDIIEEDYEDSAIPKNKVLKLLFLVYPDLNISLLAKALGLTQPAVYSMIHR